MRYRKDVKRKLGINYEPKVLSEEDLLKHSKIVTQMQKGKSTGNAAVDAKAIKSLSSEVER